MPSILQKIVQYAALSCLALITLPAAAANTVIDVLVVYTKGTADAYGGNPTTRINQLVQVSNQIYLDSGVNLELRVVKTLQVNYTDDNSADIALNAITFNQDAAFSGVAAAREQAKADMVILYRPYKPSHGSCGIAWIGGNGTNGNFSAAYIKNYMFSHVAINSCGDYVTAHELGHNMGLKHSRKQDGSGGTFPYALGHGVVNQFATIMAYQDAFNVDYWTGKMYKFSNPEILCKGLPCGVDRNNTATGADARYALNITAPQIANFYAGLPASSSASSKSSSLVSSVTSSVKSSTPSSAAKSSSSSAGNLTALAAEVERTRLAYEAAVAAVNSNTLAIQQKTTAENNLKTLLATATTNATKEKTTYDAAVKKYNDSVTAMSALIAQINTAYSAYYSAPMSAKIAKLKVYTDLLAKYSAAQALVSENYKAVGPAKTALTAVTNALNQATTNYNAAKAATLAEKARTAALTASVTSTLASYKAAQEKYNKAKNG